MIRRYLLPHLLFLALTFLLGPSLMLRFGEAPIGETVADPAQTQWNLWWAGRVIESALGGDSLPAGDHFYQTSLLFHPLGTSLAWHTTDLFWGVLLWPLQGTVGALGQHALALLLATYFTAWASWGVARQLGCGPVAAACATAALALHGYRLGEAHHLNIFSTFFFPLTLLLLLRFRAEESRAGSIVALAATAWLVLFASPFHAFGCGLLALLAATAVVAFDPENRLRFVKRCLLALLLALPALGLQAMLLSGAERPPAFGGDVQARSAADSWQFVLHPRLRMAWAGVDAESPWNELYRGQIWYLPGYLLTLILGAGLVATQRFGPRGRAATLLVLGGAFFWMLGMGPWLKLGSPWEINPAPTGIPLPGALAAFVPGLGTMRSVWHFAFLGTMLMTFAAALMVERLTTRFDWARRPVVMVLLPLMVAAENQVGTIPTTESRLDESALVLAMQPDADAVVPLPQLLHEIRGMFMFQQTIHGRPLVGGYISRDPQSFDAWKSERGWLQELEEVGTGRRIAMSFQSEVNFREDIAKHRLGWVQIELPGVVESTYRDGVARELGRLGFRDQRWLEGGAVLVRLTSGGSSTPSR